MVTSRQVSLLSEMGIPVWQLRHSDTKQAEVPGKLINIEQVDTTALLTRIESVNWLICHDSEHSQQIQRLMHAMLSAIEVEMTDICLLSTAELQVIASMEITDIEHKRLLIFGEQIVKQVFGDAATIEQLRYEPQLIFNSQLTTLVSLNLDTLLTKPEHKKQVWQDLCLAKQLS